MRRYNPSYHSPPRRGYESRERSPPRRGRGRYSGHRDENRSLLIRNIPLNCRPDDLRVPFERFGPVRDVYLPKNYYTGEPRGFAFVEFINPSDASEAQYQMNGRVFGGREITVVAATESRKRPEEMSRRTRVSRDPPGGRPSSNYDRDYSRSVSRSRSPRSPRRHSDSRGRQNSRSYSPDGRRPRSRSVSPKRHSNSGRSPREFHRDGDGRDPRRSYSNGANRGDRDLINGNEGMRYEEEGPGPSRRSGSPRRASRPSPRSRSPSVESPGLSR
ncbi:SC35-like splicing factor 30 [Wolffia australiana]